MKIFEFLNHTHTHTQFAAKLYGKQTLWRTRWNDCLHRKSHLAYARLNHTYVKWIGNLHFEQATNAFASISRMLQKEHILRCFVFNERVLLQPFWHEFIRNLLTSSPDSIWTTSSFSLSRSLYLLFSVCLPFFSWNIFHSHFAYVVQPKRERIKRNTQNHILERINPF